MSEFERASAGRGGFLRDVWGLLRREKKWWLIPLVIVLLAVAGLVIYLGARTYLTRELDRKVRTLARTEAASATDGTAGVHLHEPPIGSLREDEIAPKVAQIFDAEGRLVVESRELGSGISLVPPDVIAAALRGDVPLLTVAAQAGPARLAVVRAPSVRGMYAVAVGMYTAEDERFLRSLARLLVGVWFGGVAATGALGYVLSSRALEPIGAITSRAARIARGDFSVRLEPPVLEDEVGRMTRSLNDVLERLYASLAVNRHFAADASHELRGPVTAIAGEIDVTLKHPRDADTYEAARKAFLKALPKSGPGVTQPEMMDLMKQAPPAREWGTAQGR